MKSQHSKTTASVGGELLSTVEQHARAVLEGEGEIHDRVSASEWVKVEWVRFMTG